VKYRRDPRHVFEEHGLEIRSTTQIFHVSFYIDTEHKRRKTIAFFNSRTGVHPLHWFSLTVA